MDIHQGLLQMRDSDWLNPHCLLAVSTHFTLVCYKYAILIGSILIVYSLLVHIHPGLLQIRDSDWLNPHCLLAVSTRSPWSVTNTRM